MLSEGGFIMITILGMMVMIITVDSDDVDDDGLYGDDDNGAVPLILKT